MNKVDFRVEELMNLHTFSIGKIVEMLKNEGFEKQEIDDAINNFIRNHIEPIVEYDL